MIKLQTNREYTFPIKNEEGEIEAKVTFNFPVKTNVQFNKVIVDLRNQYLGEEENKENLYLMTHNLLSECITGWEGFVSVDDGKDLEFTVENRDLVYTYLSATDTYVDVLEAYYGTLKKK